MEHMNLFGDPDPIAAARPGGKKRSSTKPNGYAMRPGTGPEGETCKSCRFRVENENRTSRTYWKCQLMRHTWSGGTGTDVRASSPACGKWEPGEAPAEEEPAPYVGDPPTGLVLSIRQPWAWMIMNAGKDIENRDWSTKVRGRVLIHASKGMTNDEWVDAWSFAAQVGKAGNFAGNLSMIFTALKHHDTLLKKIHRGGIIGEVEIVDCVKRSDSPWFMGQYGFVLQNPRPLPFYPCRGQLGFFKI